MTDAAGTKLPALFSSTRLTPAQRRIARCLVDQASMATYMSASELAALAGVSQPSVTRFAIALGFEGYPDLRRHIAKLMSGQQADEPTGGNQFQRAVSAEQDNLRKLSDLLTDERPITEAGQALMNSQPLPVLGLRAAAPAAGYFGYFAAKIHPDVRILDAGGSEIGDQLQQARSAGARSLLAFVLPRYPRDTLAALTEARQLGMHVVSITDSPMSPAAELSDIVLPAAVGSQLVFDLHTAPMVLAMVLLQAMCDAAPTETTQRLENFELSAARRDIFST
ncbi:MurR/RpiR family transcriptional regulator [Natronoglycomyces albus]|uniref:MurR/RpiR family transcriptional regulator n=1 Tax=Natronoglycomyces albus TaxID=2811108 RepID=A0A895XM85_9ACTN|nr:MurR/RpiR family transcriptional regulator [Natronoglycomyces albus]QSB06227.1 MurR/RpiR family transcriptional regulator [Natronoglycomyces albus]